MSSLSVRFIHPILFCVSLYKAELVTENDSDSANDVRDAIYANVIGVNHNLQTTFRAVQQVKQMLGEVVESMNEEEDESDRRLDRTCVSNDACHLGGCSCDGM